MNALATAPGSKRKGSVERNRWVSSATMQRDYEVIKVSKLVPNQSFAVEEADPDRLKAENNYLLARVVEMEAKLNSALDRLNTTLEQLQQAVTPTVSRRCLLLSRGNSFIKWPSEQSMDGFKSAENLFLLPVVD